MVNCLGTRLRKRSLELIEHKNVVILWSISVVTVTHRPPCTCLMLSRVVRDFHGIHLQALVAFSNVVDPGDVGALFIYHLHHLDGGKEENAWMMDNIYFSSRCG